MINLRTTNPVEVLQVVRTNLRHVGTGVHGDPHRILTQYWDMEGNLLAEVDPWFESKREELQ